MIFHQQRVQKEQKKRSLASGPIEADMMDIERKVPVLSDLNKQKGIYDTSIFGGINTEESIFDKQAIFRTNKD